MSTSGLIFACLVQSLIAREMAPEETRSESRPKGSLASFLFSNNPVVNSPRMNAARAKTNLKMILNRPKKQQAATFQDWAGVTKPVDFFDPIGFSEDISDGRKRFYREVELKHGRLAMLAALGFIVGEQFHPLFGGNIDVPSYVAFQETVSRLPIPSGYIYPAIALAIAIPEIFSVFTFNSPAGGEPWSIKEDHEAGNLGFDPLNLKPSDKEELKEMKTKELNNGRLAMLGIAGMVAQELATGEKLF